MAGEGRVGSGEIKHKPRRSNSLKHQLSGHTSSSHSLNLAPNQTGKGSEYTAQSPTNPYPLRETVSLTQLPGGGGVARPSSGGSVRHAVGVAGYGGGTMPSGKSVSMRNIPTHHQQQQQQSDSYSAFHTDRLKTRRDRNSGIGGSLDILPSYHNRDKSKVRVLEELGSWHWPAI